MLSNEIVESRFSIKKVFIVLINLYAVKSKKIRIMLYAIGKNRKKLPYSYLSSQSRPPLIYEIDNYFCLC